MKLLEKNLTNVFKHIVEPKKFKKIDLVEISI